MTKILKAQVFNPNEVIDYADGGVISKEFIHTANGSVTLFSFDEGQKLSEHSAPFDAVVNVIDGKAHHPKAGEAIIIPAGHPHSVNAPKRFKMMLTMVRG